MALPKLATPQHNLTVPSTGKTVKYRPYLVKEEKILMMAMESDSEVEMINAIKNVIESCTEGALTDKDLTMFDLEYFFTQLRAKSVGEHSKVLAPCSNCEHKQEASIDISQSTVTGIPEKESDYIKSINDDVKIKLKFPSINSVVAVLETSKNISDIDLAYKFIANSISEIYFGEEIYDASEQTEKELQEFVESMSSQQFSEIRNFIEQAPTVSITHEFKCDSCGHDNTLELKGLSNFFG
jgi:DNA-directed RNA polymerase subunit M/transcription elongation factor TFIIS